MRIWSAAAKPFGVLRQSRSFRATTTLGDKGCYGIVRWCVNKLFSIAGRDVALRAIWVTGFGVLRQSRSFRAAITLGDKGLLRNCVVVCEQVV